MATRVFLSNLSRDKAYPILSGLDDLLRFQKCRTPRYGTRPSGERQAPTGKDFPLSCGSIRHQERTQVFGEDLAGHN